MIVCYDVETAMSAEKQLQHCLITAKKYDKQRFREDTFHPQLSRQIVSYLLRSYRKSSLKTLQISFIEQLGDRAKICSIMCVSYIEESSFFHKC